VFALIRKYREVLALAMLVLVPTLTFISRRKPASHLNPVDRAVLRATAPVERALTWTLGAGADLANRYLFLKHAREDSIAQRRRVHELERANDELSQLAQDNQRLRVLLDFAQAQPLKSLTAQVIGDSLAPVSLSRTVRIGVGEDQGVRAGMPVISHEGVVGRIQRVFGGYADVLLLVDSTSAIAARVERSRARVTVSGTGSNRRCALQFALRSDDIEDGDVLLTSGTDGIFPAGLRLGRVVDLRRKSSGMFQVAQVAPAVDVRGLEEVLVVLRSNESEAPAASK
jgi:rod shape-determining protein MreC